MFDIMHTPSLFGLGNCADKCNLNELSDLIGFRYDLGATQDWRMGFIFCDKHPLLLTRIQVSDPGPSCFILWCPIGLR